MAFYLSNHRLVSGSEPRPEVLCKSRASLALQPTVNDARNTKDAEPMTRLTWPMVVALVPIKATFTRSTVPVNWATMRTYAEAIIERDLRGRI